MAGAVAVVGNLSIDRIEGSRPRIGGGAYHAARALRLVARDPRILARCGDADRRMLVPRLAALGIPARVLHGEHTAAFSFAYTGDGRLMQVDAIGDAWTAEDARALEPHVRWVQVAPLLRSDFRADTLAALARGRRLLLDGQGLVRAPKLGQLELDADFDPDVLAHVTILKLAEEEAEIVGNVDVPELLITRGSRGSTVRHAGHTVDVPARPLPRDPTGAGDAFGAAYLSCRAEGYGPVAAARRATSVVASLL
jgi:sugar/nucleoside kinase (ribokinase family)